MKKNTILIIILIIVVIAGIYGLSQYKSGAASVDSAALNKWTRGGNDHAVTLVEYADFQCPACASYHPLLNRLYDEFGDQLRFVYRYFPLMQIHRNALSSAKAAEAAGRQNKFWEMHDILFENQKDWSNLPDPTDTFAGYARLLGLDEQQFRDDTKNGDVEKVILDHAEQGNRDSVNSTPTFFLNGTKLANPRSYDEFKAIIQAVIDKLPQPAVSASPTAAVHAHKDFMAYVNGKAIDFSGVQYQSSEQKERDRFVHLHDGNGKEIHTHKAGVTMGYFFKTLGFTFDQTCLKLDTGVSYCNTATSTLKFFVNGESNDRFDAYELKDLDRVLVSYGPTNDPGIPKQLASVSDEACKYSEKCPERGKPPTEECVGGLGTDCK